MAIGEKDSSFDAESYRLNKPTTARLWSLPALQYFMPGDLFQVLLVSRGQG